MKFPFLLAASLLLASSTFIHAEDIPKLPQKAEQLIIRKLAFKDATTEECVMYLAKVSRGIDPDKVGVPITLTGPKDEVTRVKLSEENASLAKVVRKVAALANLEIVVEGEAIQLKTRLKESRLAPKGPAVPSIPGLAPVSR
jgi:hypothetical protein